MADTGESDRDARYKKNKPYIKPGASQFSTVLDPREEASFRGWVEANNVPFDPSQAGDTDYDMRGFYRALALGDPRATRAVDPNDNRLHFTDYWKTPYHETFSAESQWATPDAPKWNDQDQLIDKNGAVIYDDRARNTQPASPPVSISRLTGGKTPAVDQLLKQISPGARGY